MTNVFGEKAWDINGLMTDGGYSIQENEFVFTIIMRIIIIIADLFWSHLIFGTWRRVGCCFGCSMTVDDLWDAVEKPDNVTQTVSTILKNYDIRLRPNFGGKLNHVINI